MAKKNKKKIDDYHDFIDSEDMLLKKVISVEEQVKNFKDILVQKMKKTRWNKIRLNVSDIPKIFNYEVNSTAYNWLPKRFRDECLEQGIHLKKARGRTYIIITMDDMPDIPGVELDE